jgi:hypothetical protein
MAIAIDVRMPEVTDDTIDAEFATLLAWEPWHYLESTTPCAPTADADCYACGATGKVKNPKGVMIDCPICHGSGKR